MKGCQYSFLYRTTANNVGKLPVNLAFVEREDSSKYFLKKINYCWIALLDVLQQYPP